MRGQEEEDGTNEKHLSREERGGGWISSRRLHFGQGGLGLHKGNLLLASFRR